MAKGAYLGISDAARKVKSMYVGVDGVARKIKKAYIGDENGLARLCWSSEVPFVYGTTTVSSGRTITINNLDIEPIYVMALCPSVSGRFGFWGDVPSTNKLTIAANSGYLSYTTSTKTGNGITFSGGTLTATNNAASGYSFNSGLYHYIVVGNTQNAVYGSKTISSNSNSLSINIGTGKTIKKVIVYGASSGDDYSTFMYAQIDNQTYRAVYADDGSGEYYEYQSVSTVTNPYSYTNGNVVISSPSAGGYWRDGTIFYCIAFE